MKNSTPKSVKMTAIFLAGFLAFSLTACGGAASGSKGAGTDSAAGSEASASDAANETGAAAADAAQPADGEGLKVVATIFPIYDWTREILGEGTNAELTMLLGNGVDLHSYQPTAADMLTIADCDVFIYVGGESDEWVEDALESVSGSDRKVVNLMDALGDSIYEEEVVEGMEADEDHDEESSEHDHDEEEGPEYDEHVWLSLRNAKVLTSAIAAALSEADAANADTYAANAAAYGEKLDALDARFAEELAGCGKDTVLFGDRFPFRYLTEDYGLNYYAAFVGCSAETEASFETIIFLADKVDELGLHTILTIEGQNHGIAEAIRDNTATKDQTIASMNSLQGTTLKQAEEGATYLSAMEENLAVLTEALK